MDTLTHMLAGAVVAVPAKERFGRAGVVGVMAGTVLPDADMLVRFFGADTYLKYHRVVLNSLPGALLLSLAVAYFVWRYGRRKDFAAVWALVAFAVGLHVVMDLTNSYGVKLIWPFSEKWYALDSVFIVDPFMAGLFILALAAMRFTTRRTALAAACFLLLFSYWGFRYTAHAAALGKVRALYPDAVKVGAFPAPVNPFMWRVVAEDEAGFEVGWHDILDGSWKDRESFAKQPDTDAVRAARKARTARIFLDFARFPLVSYTESGGYTTVYFRDLRFSFSPGDDRFVASVRVGPGGTVDEGAFRF